MGYSKKYLIENQMMVMSFEEQEHHSSFKTKINASDEEKLPRWIVELNEENKIREELKMIQKEVDSDYITYIRLKKIYDGGLNNHQANKDFQHFSGSSKIILK